MNAREKNHKNHSEKTNRHKHKLKQMPKTEQSAPKLHGLTITSLRLSDYSDIIENILYVGGIIEYYVNIDQGKTKLKPDNAECHWKKQHNNLDRLANERTGRETEMSRPPIQ